jgi:hypothetical protein
MKKIIIICTLIVSLGIVEYSVTNMVKSSKKQKIRNDNATKIINEAPPKVQEKPVAPAPIPVAPKPAPAPQPKPKPKPPVQAQVTPEIDIPSMPSSESFENFAHLRHFLGSSDYKNLVLVLDGRIATCRVDITLLELEAERIKVFEKVCEDIKGKTLATALICKQGEAEGQISQKESQKWIDGCKLLIMYIDQDMIVAKQAWILKYDILSEKYPQLKNK